MKIVDFEFKGTKGQWEYVNTSLKDFNLTSVICEKEVIAQINSDKEFRKTNALLISKSPEMIKQHIDDLDYIKSWVSDLENGRTENVIEEMKKVFNDKYSLCESALINHL